MERDMPIQATSPTRPRPRERGRPAVQKEEKHIDVFDALFAWVPGEKKQAPRAASRKITSSPRSPKMGAGALRASPGACCQRRWLPAAMFH